MDAGAALAHRHMQDCKRDLLRKAVHVYGHDKLATELSIPRDLLD
jgi:hypothetical protein